VIGLVVTASVSPELVTLIVSLVGLPLVPLVGNAMPPEIILLPVPLSINTLPLLNVPAPL